MGSWLSQWQSATERGVRLQYSNQHRLLVNSTQWSVVCGFIALTLTPLVYAIARLESVTEMSSIAAIGAFFNGKNTLNALEFTILEATLSTLFTVVVGLPLAWALGRYNWSQIKLLRAILAVPFVTPSIIVAMGFLMLIDSPGPLTAIGIDLRLETGLIYMAIVM